MKRMTCVLAAVGWLLGSTADVWAVNFLAPGDAIIAIDVDPPASNSSYPDNEAPPNVVDGTLAKYLNFGGKGSGFIVTPNSGSSTIQSLQLTTANDANGRDPTSWEIWGTNSSIVSADNSDGLGEPWTFIGGGPVTLPAARDTLGSIIPVTNSTAYSSYKMVFPTNAGDDLFQIAEASFYPSIDGTGTDFLSNGDPVLAIQFGPTSNYPGAEGPGNVLDGDPTTKYLNFGRENSGFIVTPQFGPAEINGLQLTTPNDAFERDPASWVLFGTNDPINTPDNGLGNGESWTLIDQGTVTLPDTRETVGDVIPVNNAAGTFTSYRMDFPTVRDGANANSMQIADVKFFAPDIVSLEINRATGEVRIRADQDITFQSYEVLSPLAGALDDSQWTSIASTGADPDDDWEETSTPGDPTQLAERDIPANGADNGFNITAGNSYSLGNVWAQVPPIGEDLQFDLRDLSGTRIGAGIEYVGPEVQPGDYNNDGAVNIEDWPTFRGGYGSDLTGMSPAQAYLHGDLDQDLDSDIHDFNLFVELAGGAAALFGTAVPEPTTFTMLMGIMLAGLGLLRDRKGRVAGTAVVAFMLVSLCGPSSAQAQSFTNVGQVPASITIPADQMDENADSGPVNFFDDDFLDDPGTIDGELFLLDYNDPNLQGGPYAQYAGLGPEPKTVFFDYGSSVSANWFAYAQRSGGDPTADRVGMFEFWFSNTDFGGVVPSATPDAVVELLPSDPRLLDSALRPYSLSGTQTGRHVAMRLTVSEVSANQPTNNIGGHEFRLLSGPADVVLEVDRSNGALTLKNDLSGAQSIELNSYMIESPSGALDPAGFSGLGGTSGDFPMGDGSGNGWEIGGGSHPARLADAYFSTVSTLSPGTAGLSLGSGYNPLSLAEDLAFTWTNADGDIYNSRVQYVGVPPEVGVGDYNNNGQVEQGDLDLVLLNWGAAWPPPVEGWVNNQPTDGKIDQNDLDGVLLNWGNMAGAGSAVAVPEPAALWLTLTGVALVAAGWRRRR